MDTRNSYLAKISFSSCSDTNWPRLATNSVEQGALAASGGLGGWCCEPPEPTGLARVGLGKKWRVPADTCIVVGWMAAGWVIDMWGCNGRDQIASENGRISSHWVGVGGFNINWKCSACAWSEIETYSPGAWAAVRELSVLDLVRGRIWRALEDAIPDALEWHAATRQPQAIQQLLRPPNTLTDDAIARVLPERMVFPDLKVHGLELVYWMTPFFPSSIYVSSNILRISSGRNNGLNKSVHSGAAVARLLIIVEQPHRRNPRDESSVDHNKGAGPQYYYEQQQQ